MELLKTSLAVAVAALGLIGSAHAAIYDVGVVGASGFTKADVALPDFSESGPVPFADTFNFTLGTGSKAQTGITTFFYGSGAGDLPNLTFTLRDGTSQSIFHPTFALTSDGANVAAGQFFSGLKTGVSYGLTISGTDANNLGTTYAFQIAAVPEPETYAMLLAGLGLVAGIARRRRTAN